MNAVNSAEHHRASTFYVDSKGGCDENDGRSEAAPFKTLERVSRESYGPGDPDSVQRRPDLLRQPDAERLRPRVRPRPGRSLRKRDAP